jgi:tight adherence protein C
MTAIFLYLACTLTFLCLLALILLPFLLRPSPEAARILDVVTSNRPDQRMVGAREQVQETFLDLATRLRSRLGFTHDIKLTNRLLAAGFRESNAADLFFAAQFLTPSAAAFGGSFMPTYTVFWVMIFALIGYVSPDLWLTIKTRGRKSRIRRSIPDAIDLLVICVDAGLGLDQALLRVGQELQLSHPEIHEEFNQVQLEQRAGVTRLEAWKNLADRTQIEEFVSFVNMLTQTDRFGTPIVRALTRFADDLRIKRRQRAEEAAAKTKIKIIFPLVLCIFPCLFIVLLAPAILSVMRGLKGMGN